MRKRNFLSLFLFLFLIVFANQLNAQVGIGEANPTNTLHVKPSDPNEDPLRIEDLNQIMESDSAFVVVDPSTGVVRFMPIDSLLNHVNFSVDQSVTNELQNASQVPLDPGYDMDGNGFIEESVQDAVVLLASKLPKGTYRTIGDARSAGLVNGDSFYTHPQGVFGCSGCIITLYEGME